MLSAVTVCLVPEARQGPFVFHEGLDAGCRAAVELGFDGVEIFPESAAGLEGSGLARRLAAHGLTLAAVGSGAGWVKHKLHLCHPESTVRAQAVSFIGELVDRAGELGAPVIVGSMQGRGEGAMAREQAIPLLAEALHALGDRAARHGQVLLYEPLNRYETNLFNRQADAAECIRAHGLTTVKLLCDLFHMNIEEADMPAALIACGDLVGHIHWADSNRQAIGFGHTTVEPIVGALAQIGYHGYLSAEVFPFPTPLAAARQSIESCRTFTKG
jgi:sugar phosphate isomerase/epimerase